MLEKQQRMCDEVGVHMRARAQTRQKTEMDMDNACICVEWEMWAFNLAAQGKQERIALS